MRPSRSGEYPILSVSSNEAVGYETLGSKDKFWYRDEQRRRCLFKKCRPNTGEDWAEKVASELAELLGLPHAVYELAICDDKDRGTVCPTNLPQASPGSESTLFLGNQILAAEISGYDDPPPEGERRPYRQKEHTLDRVLVILEKWSDLRLPPGWDFPKRVSDAVGLFAGYLLLDAWIGNVDRHHENWAFVGLYVPRRNELTLHLAPTYDHASSLGRELSEGEREKRLKTKDRRFSVEGYISRARSAFFHEGKQLHVREAFRMSATRSRDAARAWLGRLESITDVQVQNVLQRMPDERMSQLAKDFAWRMLDLNRSALLDMREELQ